MSAFLAQVSQMNFLSREKQIEVVSALTEGLGIRATARITGVGTGRFPSRLAGFENAGGWI